MVLDLRSIADHPGAPDETFEALIRAIVRRQYGAFGRFRARRNQPGVEFFLEIDRTCSLGEPGRVVGWSCKWFLLPASHELTSGQRSKITDSIAKAIKHVDGLTDFVLCLPERPAKKDLDWFETLAGPLTISLHLWTPDEIDAELAGVEVLRRSFLGELVVTAEGLAEAQERSLAPIRSRWLEDLHTYTHAEEQIETALLRPDALAHFAAYANLIAENASTLAQVADDVEEADLADRVRAVACDMGDFATELLGIPEAVGAGRVEHMAELLRARPHPETSPRDLRLMIRELRKLRLPAALVASTFPADVNLALSLVDELADLVSVGLFAVIASAGHGKTHLSAQLTSPGDSLAGLLIHGSYLKQGSTLDDLARRMPGLGLDRFEDLLEAVDAAGARAGCRVPIVIDGLNEAQRPLEWRPLLDEIVPVLHRFPNALLVVTIRESLAEQVLPENTKLLDLDWTELEVDKIVQTYFTHYLIEPAGAWLPMRLFRNPLFVRMYCEAANPERAVTVGVEALPTSMIGVFVLYRERFVNRLATEPTHVAVPADQIMRRLGLLALELWNANARRLPFDEVTAIVGDGGGDWNESLYQRLEEEGVLFRDEAAGYMAPEAGILFDRFAGFLIADAILSGLAPTELDATVGDETFWARLVGPDAHPLAEDVTFALADLVPRTFRGRHLWQIAPAEHRTRCLIATLDLESELLDDDTVDALADLVTDWKPPGRARHPFDRLFEIHDGAAHRLNAQFLNRILQSFTLPVRDLMWTEWLRSRRTRVFEVVEAFATRWAAVTARDDSDALAALTLMWIGASTDLDLRDRATEALTLFGRSAPQRLFELAEPMLDADDGYIVERVLAATFGAASARQMADPGGSFETALTSWLTVLYARFGPGGSSPTSHELARTYIRATFEFAGHLHRAALPDGVDPAALALAAPPPPDSIVDGSENAKEVSRTFGMDFENYIIGSVIAGRSNYDFKHPGFVGARDQVRGRIWDLGWRAETFGSIDKAIKEEAERWRSSTAKVERYGKKYGWIAYFELVGRLDDAGLVRDRWVGGGRAVTPDIDPTFPAEPPPAPLPLPLWAVPEPEEDQEWVRSGAVTITHDLWSPERLGDVDGPWLLAEGFLEHGAGGRRVFGFFRTVLVDDTLEAAALELLGDREYLGNHLIPDAPYVRGVYAGEMPWSDRFRSNYEDDETGRGPALDQRYDQVGVPVELLGVDFTTGTDRTSTGLERSYVVPSFPFCDLFDLRQRPGTIDLVEPNGEVASMNFGVPDPWRGQLLFIRTDLVKSYAAGRGVIRIAWGEREVALNWNSPPAWLREIHNAHLNLWRQIEVLS